jgi:hypothetical protein
LDFKDALEPAGPLNSAGGKLLTDGSGVAVFGYPGGAGSIGIPDFTLALFDEHLVGDVLNGTMMLAEHALRSGAIGSATIAAELTWFSWKPVLLAQYRTQNMAGALHDTHGVSGGVGPARHTVNLESLRAEGRDAVAVARLLLADLESAFGLPEPQQITMASQLVRNRFQADWHGAVEEWAARRAVELVDNYE